VVPPVRIPRTFSQASGEFFRRAVPGSIPFVRERWLSRRSIALHAAALVFVPACFLAAWWQITRATDGNGLSYLYAVEWPVFAILGAYFWWMLIHTDYDSVGLRGMRETQPTPVEMPVTTPVGPSAALAASGPVDDDPELSAYNDRLASLSRQGAKTWRKPERTVVRRNVSS